MEDLIFEARTMVEQKNSGVQFIKMDGNKALFEADGQNDQYRLFAVDLDELEYGVHRIYETTVNVEADDYSSDVELNEAIYSPDMSTIRFESKTLKEYKRESTAVKFAEKYAKENNVSYVGVFYS